VEQITAIKSDPLSYAAMKEALLGCIPRMLAIETIDGHSVRELSEKIHRNVFNLVVVGQFKRGKTSLINALMGADLLPVAVVPLTSIVTIITYGERLTVRVFFNDDRMIEIDKDTLADYVTEKGNPRNVKDVREVVITYPSDYLREGVRLIDTPGVGSIYQHNTDVAYHYLPKSDAALFLISVDQPISKAELDFLSDVKEHSNKIFFILNKADYLGDKDLQEAMDFARSVLKEAMGTEVKIFPLSSRLALEGKLAGDEGLIDKSHIRQFSDLLNEFLIKEKGNVLLLSITNNLLRLLSQARFQTELEIKSLTHPLEDLQKKIAIFEAKKQEVMLDKQDFDILLEGEIKRLSKDLLDEDITKFRKQLLAQEQINLERHFVEVRALPSRQLREALQEGVITRLRDAFNLWRKMEDDRLAKAFEAKCKRFSERINDTVDALMQFSSDLFEIPFEAIKTEALWSAKSHFYYRFKEQPGGIEMISSSLTLSLPKFIGDRIMLKKMQDYLVRAVDLQLGSAGNDFEDRLQRSKLAFRWEMLQRIEATIEGIERAVKKGLEQRNRGELEVRERQQQLTDIMARLNELNTLLTGLKKSLSQTY